MVQLSNSQVEINFYNSFNSMDDKLELLINAKGKKLLIKANPSCLLWQIIEAIRTNGLDINKINSQLRIINTANFEELDPNEAIISIPVHIGSGARIIEIRQKFKEIRNNNIDYVEYQAAAEAPLIDALESILANNLSRLQMIGSNGKISPTLFSLLISIYEKCQSRKYDGQERYQEEIMKLMSTVIEKQREMESLNLSVIEANEKTQYSRELVNELLKKQQEQEQKRLEVERQLYQEKQRVKQQQEIDLQNKREIERQNEQKRQQKQQSEREKLIEMERLKEKEKRDEQFSKILLKGSKTLASPTFSQSMGKLSQKLCKQVQMFSQQKITQIQSQLYLEGSNNELFMGKIKEKKNFILLFSSASRLFGIYSPTPMNSTNLKCDQGILFSLHSDKFMRPNNSKNLWRWNNIELKIGNESLIFSQPTGQPSIMKMGVKRSLKDSFPIDDQELRDMLGDSKQIIIDAFECLCVRFASEPNA